MVPRATRGPSGRSLSPARREKSRPACVKRLLRPNYRTRPELPIVELQRGGHLVVHIDIFAVVWVDEVVLRQRENLVLELGERRIGHGADDRLLTSQPSCSLLREAHEDVVGAADEVDEPRRILALPSWACFDSPLFGSVNCTSAYGGPLEPAGGCGSAR